jgi:hypothetical protein
MKKSEQKIMSAAKRSKNRNFFNFLRSVRRHRQIEIFDFVKIQPISKSHKLHYGTHAISVPIGIPDI